MVQTCHLRYVRSWMAYLEYLLIVMVGGREAQWIALLTALSGPGFESRLYLIWEQNRNSAKARDFVNAM